HWRPAADDRERMMISRSSTVIWAFVLFAIAVYSVHAGGKGHVVEIGLSIASVAYGALLGVFLLGTLTRYATQTGAILGMIAGFALNILLWLHPDPIAVGPITIPHVAWTWYVFLGALTTFGIGTVASFIFRGKPKAKSLTTAALLALFAFYANPTRAQARAPHLHRSFPVDEKNSAEVPNFTAINNLMNDAVAAKKLPGAVVLIGHDNKLVFEQAYGHRSLEPTVEPMTEDTIFDMASLSKCLSTAVAVMQLYEEHKLNFDDPVAKYLPAFAANGKQNVTIRELLTHYSGLPPDVNLKDTPWGLAAPDKAEGIRRALASPLVTTPGTHFEYSDINFITLGALVEKLSGEPLDVYAQQHIFTPLKMTHTHYLPGDKVCGFVPRYSHSVGPDGVVLTRSGGFATQCAPDQWDYSWMPLIAPTTYDDEGTASTNPDFGHMLRGTVNDPTTRRMGGVAGHAGVFSTTADIALFAQALLDKLLHNTGPFPLKQSTLKLMTEPQQPSSAETTATIFTPDGKTTKGVATRGFGWDINSPFSRPRGGVFPIGSFGHTGFTGTSLWMDPTSDTYVILLSNAVHPRGNPPISVLRGEIATAAGEALHLNENASSVNTPESSAPTLTGIDILESTHFAALAEAAERHNHHLRLGLLTNQTGLDSEGRRTVDILAIEAPKFVPGVKLTTLFSPEHGIFGKQDTTKISSETDPDTHLPVISLYGPKDSDKRPKPEDLAKLDAVVIDLQDAGVRFYTYESVVGYFIEAAAQAHIEVILLDRPNPIGGEKVQGPVSDAGLESYTDYMPLPVRHGLTLGELARYINGERHLPTASPDVQVPINAHLTVVLMQNWTRSEYFDQTRLPWTNPSPNLRSIIAATLYPGVALLETTNVSVGRGTPTPFEHFGAPYIDAPQLAAYLNARKIPGVTFASTSFFVDETSNHYPYHGQTIPGIHITLTDRNALDAPELGIELLSALHRLYPRQFNLAKAERLVASVNTMLALDNNEDPRAIAASWTSDLAAFQKRRTLYLLYN
ncbi:MAG: serine hydrolase, partial [Edaphobacter sp.]